MRVVSDQNTKIKNWGFYLGFAGYEELKSYDLNRKSPQGFQDYEMIFENVSLAH